MACIGCEKYERRITNVYRDLELKEMFEKLTGYSILIDCFICDNCNTKLQESLKFQEDCIRIYKKNNPNCDEKAEINKNQDQIVNLEDKQSEYIILETTSEVFEEQSESQSQLIDDEFTIFEYNETKEIEYEEPEKKKSTRNSSRLKKEVPQDSIMDKDSSEIEDNLMCEDLISMTVPDDQNMSYKVESLDDSQDSKKQRKSYTVQQKLEIIEFSEKMSNREAARKFNLNESTIRCFRRQKEMLLSMDPTRSTKRHGTPYWPELETKLKAWADKQSVRPKMSDVKAQAINIANNLGYDNFSGSNTYIFKFMQRNNIETASPRPRKKIKIDSNGSDTSDK